VNTEDLEQKLEMRRREFEAKMEALKNAPVKEVPVNSPTMCPVNETACYWDCSSKGYITIDELGPVPHRIKFITKDCFQFVRYRDLIRKSGLQGEELKHTFDDAIVDDWNREAIKVLQNWDPKLGRGIILTSHRTKSNPRGNGTGKSYMMHALTHKLCREGYHCFFSRTVDYLADLRKAYDEGGNEFEITRKYVDVDVLLWDDLGKENIKSDWVAERFYYIIDRRITLNRPLVISTNLSMPEIAEHYGNDNFGPAIASRLAGNCNILYLDGPDRRLP